MNPGWIIAATTLIVIVITGIVIYIRQSKRKSGKSAWYGPINPPDGMSGPN